MGDQTIRLSEREAVTVVMALQAYKTVLEAGIKPRAPPQGVPCAFEGASLDALQERFTGLVARAIANNFEAEQSA